ncbi:MAG: hypothetical protein Athens101410_247 [Parcubacteria group bacterium Athens1014_10]|nr:MAG: hypothetical protein Athens101410_247 [Parcubacteria group bacterium Athens1014_10]
MIVFDLILLFILFAFIWFGFFYGLIYTIGSVLGIIIGTWVGGLYYAELAEIALPVFFGNINLSKVLCFLVIFIIVSKLISFIFYLLDKTFKFISIVPFLKSINRLLGALLGFIEGMIVLGLIFYFYGKYPFFSPLNDLITQSQIVPYFLQFAKVLMPLLPEVLKQMETILKFKFNFSW